MDGEWKAGLEDVIAARSGICTIDGLKGQLYYRGYEIGELASHVSFEEVTWLLWHGELPTAGQARELTARLQEARALPAAVRELLERLPRDCHPLDALRPAVSLAASIDPDVRSNDAEANLRKACRIMSLVPATVAAWQRVRTGREPVPGISGGSHAAWFLSLLDGREPTHDAARVMDLVLALHADHEFNASTFALRVAVATLADFHAATVAAISTLKGPKHGGANEDVLVMLREIGDPAKADDYIAKRLGVRAGLSKAERGDPRARVPGFGHRVYRVDDARARVLRGMAKSMAAATGREKLFEVAERVYEATTKATGLPVNVDFFSAVVYDALQIPPDFCTSIFAVGRVAGWCAHALEQYADNRLIRPRADYTGPAPRTMETSMASSPKA